jgi:hypothetical protein
MREEKEKTKEVETKLANLQSESEQKSNKEYFQLVSMKAHKPAEKEKNMQKLGQSWKVYSLNLNKNQTEVLH